LYFDECHGKVSLWVISSSTIFHLPFAPHHYFAWWLVAGVAGCHLNINQASSEYQKSIGD